MSEVQTLARGLKILDLLAEADDGMSSGELADALIIDKGAMSRLMKTLESYGYAERDPGNRLYYVGSHLHEMSRHAGQHASLREMAMPLIESISTETTENAHLAVLRGAQAITIADVPSQQVLRVVSEVGRRLPLHASAVGKCLLAFSEMAITRELKRYTKKTICDKTRLKAALENIRLNQTALDVEELTPGVCGLAVPVRNREGRVIASLGVSGPRVRLPQRALKKNFTLLTSKAHALSKQLGYTPSK